MLAYIGALFFTKVTEKDLNVMVLEIENALSYFHATPWTHGEYEL